MGRVTVRRATPDDVAAFLGLFVGFLGDSIYRTTPVDLGHASREFLRITRRPDPHALALIAEQSRDGPPVGVLVAVADRNMFGVLGSTDLFTYALPGSGATPALIRAYHRWASRFQLPGIQTSSGPNPRYERLIERLGYVPIGITYVHRDSLPAREMLRRNEPAQVE